MARPPLYDDALRSRLLAAATDLVEHNGVAAIALREVAAAADTSTSAVYTLFGGKTQLVAAVMDAAFASFGAAQRAAAPDGLRALGIAYRTWALAHPELYRMMFSAPGASAPDEGSGGADREPDASDLAMAPLQEAIARAQRAGGMADVPVGIAATAIWGQVHGIVSLQLAGLGPAGLDWDAAYTTVLDTITRAWSPPTP
ncbi:TetR-like C-terminal domain-containing protein [Microbacterium sp. KR10-403]|uniref:TetR-like C-terminal domain-containing protein n=1 Tax=Microbacterium sp. KR10-403 TaxID=3158581 RepID=UPI0032E45D14